MNRPQMGPRMVSEPGQQTMIRHRESAAADTLQEKVFTNWANFILKSRNLQIQSVLKNIGDGVILLQLAEILTGTKIHTYNKKPNQPAQKLENIQIAVNTFKQDGLKLSVDNKGIVEMEPKPTLAMFWNIIVHYGLGSAVPDSTFGKSGDQDEDLNRLAAELERLRAENADYARIKEENSRQKEGTLSEVSDPCAVPNITLLVSFVPSATNRLRSMLTTGHTRERFIALSITCKLTGRSAMVVVRSSKETR